MFERIINQGELDDNEAFHASDRNSDMYKNYLMFKDFLKGKDNIQEYVDVLNKFDIIPIALDSSDDKPQVIFENINSTGEPLTDGDKIRNYALLLDTEEARRYIFKTYWEDIEDKLWISNKKKNVSCISDFFRHFIMTLEGRWIKTAGEAYERFKVVYDKAIPNQTHAEIDKFYKKVQSQLANYLFIAHLKNENAGFNFLRDYNFRLYFLGKDVRISFLMNVLEHWKNNEITQQDVVKVFDYLERYLVRLMLCDIKTEGLNMLVPAWDNGIMKQMKEQNGAGKEQNYADTFIEFISNKAGYKSVPNDNYLSMKIEKERYQAERIRYVLATISDKNDKPTNESLKSEVLRNIHEGKLKLQNEHIMPKKLTEQWTRDLGEDYERIHDEYLNTLANMTLTGYNQSYSNKPFQEKLNAPDGFADSPLYVNRYIKDNFTEWNEEAILKRQKWIIEEIKKAWEWPKEYLDPNITTASSRTRNIETGGKELDMISNKIKTDDVKRTEPYRIIINDDEIPVKSWKTVIQEVLGWMANNNSNIFQKLLSMPNNNSISRTISQDDTLFRVPKPIPNTDYFFEGNQDAFSFAKWIQQILLDTEFDGEMFVRLR